jgi:hypothetical protein
MSLAAASRDLGRRCVCRYQASRKLDASVDEPVCAPAKFGAGPNPCSRTRVKSVATTISTGRDEPLRPMRRRSAPEAG